MPTPVYGAEQETNSKVFLLSHCFNYNIHIFIKFYFIYRRSVKKLLYFVSSLVVNFCLALASVPRNHFGTAISIVITVFYGCMFSGPANDWYDTFHPYFIYSQTIRQWFAINVLLRHPERIPQYLLECPSTEVSLAVQINLWGF